MKTRSTLAAVALAGTLLVAGCASSGLSARETPGYDVSAYLQATQMSSLDAARTPTDGRAPAARAPIVKPAHLAVAQIGEVTPPQDMLNDLAAKAGLFQTVQGISGFSGRSYRNGKGDGSVRQHLDSMLGVAADIGADYLLVYGGTVDTHDRGGQLSLLDLTIVGAFVVPSNKLQGEARASAVLLDTTSGRPVATVSADASDTRYSATIGKSGRQMEQKQQLRDETLDELTTRIIERFEVLE